MSVVTFVLPGPPERPIGGYKVVYAYASHLAEQGHSVTIYQPRVPAGARYIIEPDDRLHRSVETLRRVRQARSYVKRMPARPSWFDLDPAVHVRNSVRLSPRQIQASDAIVATAVHTAPLVAAAVMRQRCKGIYFLQHFETWAAPLAFVESTWQLPLTRVVIAPWLAEKGRELGVPTILVPNAIDAAEFPPGPPISERGIAVLALVSSAPFKRTDLVVSVMRQLDAQFEGFTGATFGTCERPAGLPESVTHYFDPPRERLVSLYADSRIYLCASDSEGWHLPAAEAMATGAALVSTDNGGVRAYADSAALFAPVGDATALGDAALGLLQDDARCQELASRGQQQILARSPAQAAQEFAQVVLPER